MNYVNNLTNYIQHSSDIEGLKYVIKIIKNATPENIFEKDFEELCHFLQESNINHYLHSHFTGSAYKFDKFYIEKIYEFLDTIKLLCEIHDRKYIYTSEELDLVLKAHISKAKRTIPDIEYFLNHYTYSIVPHYSKPLEFCTRNALVIFLLVVALLLLYILYTYKPRQEIEYMVPSLKEEIIRSPIEYDYPNFEKNKMSELYS